MIYSRQCDFLFIKGRKVAGTSVEIALSAVCGPDDIVTRITPIDEYERLKRGGRGAQNYSTRPAEERRYLEVLAASGPDAVPQKRSRDEIYRSHISLRDFVARFGSLPTSRIFGVERSPYAKVVSMAVMAANFRRYKQTGKSMSLDIAGVRKIIASGGRAAVIETCRNIDLYRDASGKIAVRLLRHENLAAEFAALLREFGISTAPELPHAKQGINSNTVDPRDVFSRDQIDRINDVFAEEFDAFGYERV